MTELPAGRFRDHGRTMSHISDRNAHGTYFRGGFRHGFDDHWNPKGLWGFHPLIDTCGNTLVWFVRSCRISTYLGVGVNGSSLVREC